MVGLRALCSHSSGPEKAGRQEGRAGRWEAGGFSRGGEAEMERGERKRRQACTETQGISYRDRSVDGLPPRRSAVSLSSLPLFPAPALLAFFPAVLGA